MTTISRAMIAVGLVMGSGIGAMADTVWTLNDVIFDNGNQATGFFTTNPTTTAVDSFDIQISGPDTIDAFTPTQAVNLYLPSVLGIANADLSKYVDLYLASPMTSGGGTIHMTAGYDCPGCGTLLIDSEHIPSVIGVASTPEPSSVPFLGASVVLMGVLTRRKPIRAS